MKKTLVFVYRSSLGDFTGNGLTNNVEKGYLFWDCTREEAIEWCKQSNVDPTKHFIIKERELWGKDHSYAEPLDIIHWGKGGMQMFGGNFIYTSDNNFYMFRGETIGRPIKVHDRFEHNNEYYD